MLNVLSGETGAIPVRVRRREALYISVLAGDAAILGTGPLAFAEKAEWFAPSRNILSAIIF